MNEDWVPLTNSGKVLARVMSRGYEPAMQHRQATARHVTAPKGHPSAHLFKFEQK